MKIETFKNATVIETTPDKYLILKGLKDSEKIIGKPRKIVLGNDGFIPEFEEREVNE